MEKPLVSIITPSYNQGDFIEETIWSVKRQEYVPIEHIIIDGGSTDETLEILKEHENSYNLRWWSEQDAGQANAINKGFRESRGGIIGWLNSDDVYYTSEVVSLMVKRFSEQPETDICYGNITYIDNNSRIYRYQLSPSFNSERLRIYNFIPQPGVFFRSNVVRDEHLNEELEFAMDYEYWLRLAKKGYGFSHVNEMVAGFRTHDSAKGPRLGVDLLEEERERLNRIYGKDGTFKKYLYKMHSKALQISANVWMPVTRGKNPPVLRHNDNESVT